MTPASSPVRFLLVALLPVLCVLFFCGLAPRCGGTNEEEQRAVLDAVKAHNAASLQALRERHALELAMLTERLDAALQSAERERTRQAALLEAERVSRVKEAAASQAALKRAVLEAAAANEAEVHGDADTVWLSRRAALSWLERDLKLRHDLDLSEKDCTLSLVRRERELVVPLVKERQAAEVAAGDLDARLRLALAERDASRRQAALGKSETLKWSLISGTVGLLVGATTAGLGTAYLLHR